MNALRTLLFAVLLSCPLASPADGNKLLQQCGDAEHFLDTGQMLDEFSIGICMGMLEGVRHTMMVLDNGLEKTLRLCWPENGIKNRESIRIVTRYLRNNPEKLHKDEAFLTMLAFREAYRCK